MDEALAKHSVAEKMSSTSSTTDSLTINSHPTTYQLPNLTRHLTCSRFKKKK